MELEKLRKKLETVKAGTTIHIKYQTDMSKHFTAKYAKNPNHLVIFKVTEGTVKTGINPKNIKGYTEPETRYAKDGHEIKREVKPVYDENDMPYTIKYWETTGNYVLNLEYDKNYAQNHFKTHYELRDADDAVKATFDKQYLLQLDEEVRKEEEAAGENAKGMFKESFVHPKAKEEQDPAEEKSTNIMTVKVQDIIEFSQKGMTESMQNMNESKCPYLDLDDDEFDIVDDFVSLYSNLKVVNSINEISNKAKYKFSDSKNRDYYYNYDNDTVYINVSNMINESKAMNRIFAKDIVDKEFENAWSTLDIDMNANVYSVEDFNKMMKDVIDLKW